jgi:hypothetical protein
MNAPAVVIRLELEATPKVTFDCLSEGEQVRMVEHLGAHPEQLELIARAQEIIAAAGRAA